MDNIFNLRRKKIMENEIKVLTVIDLQQALGIGRETAYALMHNKSFPSIKMGGRYFVEIGALQRWLKNYEGKEIYL